MNRVPIPGVGYESGLHYPPPKTSYECMLFQQGFKLYLGEPSAEFRVHCATSESANDGFVPGSLISFLIASFHNHC